MLGFYESPDGLESEEEQGKLREQVREMLEGEENSGCEICGSREWVMEDTATRFGSLDEAQAWLDREETRPLKRRY